MTGLSLEECFPGDDLASPAVFSPGAADGVAMAPFPDEVDVFTGPHWRMKQLVELYSEKVRVRPVLSLISPIKVVFSGPTMCLFEES